MDLQRLKYFVEVARQRHFSKAAEACRVSQPSLSQQIMKLEEELGGKLFERTREKVGLTALGQDFLKHARAIIAEVQAAEEFAQRMHEHQLRTIRIGAIPTIAPYLAPPLLAAIRKAHPKAHLELLEAPSAVLTEALMTGKIDYALLSPPTSVDDECDHLTLARDELLLTLPREHPLAKVKQLSQEQLEGEQVILLENSHCLSAQVGAYCRKLGLSEHLDIRGSQIDTLLGLVENGFGLTFTPALAAQAHKHRQVVHRHLPWPACTREIRLVWIKQQFLTRTQHAVLEAARSVAVKLS